MLDDLPGLLWSSDAEGNVDFLNQRWLDYTGFSPEEIFGWNWLLTDMAHPDDAAELARQWRGFLATGREGEVEARLRRRDGEYRWFLFRVAPARDEAGRIVKWWGLNLDIDDRVWAESLLRCEKQLLDLMGQGAQLAQVLARFCELLDELTGARSAILLKDRSGRLLPAAGTPDLPADLWWPLADLGRFVVAPGRPLSERDRQILERFSGLACLLVERSLAQSTLERSRAHLAKAEQLSRSGSFGWCLAETDMLWSDETCRILGYPEGTEPSLDRFYARFVAEDLGALQDQIRRAQHDVAEHRGALRLVTPDGRQKFVDVVVQADGREIIGALMDVTILRRHADAMAGLTAVSQQTLEKLTRTADSDELVLVVLQPFFELFGVSTVRVWLGDESSLALHLHVDDGRIVEVDKHVPHLSLRPLGPGEVAIEPAPIQNLLERGCTTVEELAVRPIRMVAQVPLYFGSRMRGQLTLRFPEERELSPDDLALTHVLANLLTLVLELRQLTEQAESAAVDAERSRMARDMHDSLVQSFTGILLQLRNGTQEAVGRAAELAEAGLQEARRSVRALRPLSLDGLALPAALQGTLMGITLGTPLRLEFTTRGVAGPYPAQVEENLLRVAQEVSSNVVRHAQASVLTVELAYEEDGLRFVARDDGRGMSPNVEQGVGLRSLVERAVAIGGSLSVDSTPGEGTTVSLRIPR